MPNPSWHRLTGGGGTVSGRRQTQVCCAECNIDHGEGMKEGRTPVKVFAISKFSWVWEACNSNTEPYERRRPWPNNPRRWLEVKNGTRCIGEQVSDLLFCWFFRGLGLRWMVMFGCLKNVLMTESKVVTVDSRQVEFET